jgi:hypothetical protein
MDDRSFKNILLQKGLCPYMDDKALQKGKKLFISSKIIIINNK